MHKVVLCILEHPINKAGVCLCVVLMLLVVFGGEE